MNTVIIEDCTFVYVQLKQLEHIKLIRLILTIILHEMQQ